MKKPKFTEQQKNELEQLREELANRPRLITEDEIQDYSKKDVQAAIAFLRLLLEHPEQFKKMCNAIYQETIAQETQYIKKLENDIKALEELENA